MEPLISVIMPTYNGAAYLAESVGSVWAQNVPCEILVYDDLSEDGSAQIATDLGCKVTRKKRRGGPVESKNLGIMDARAPYWLTLDQDDVLKAGAFEAFLGEFAKNQELELIMGLLEDFCSPDAPEKQVCVRAKPYFGILTGAGLFKRSLFDKIGPFPPGVITGEALDLFDRLARHGIAWKRIESVTSGRRIHRNNYGVTNRENEFNDYAKILRQKLARTAQYDKNTNLP